MYGHNHKKKRRVWYHPFARSCAVHKWAELVSTTASCIDLEGRYGYQRKWAFRSGIDLGTLSEWRGMIPLRINM